MTKNEVKNEADLENKNLPVDMENWNKQDLSDYREKLRFAFEHGVLPARYVDDKVNGKISEKKLDEAMACISYGRTLNMSPKLALTNTMVVNGTMTIWGDALPAVIYQSGLMEYKEETFDATTMTAICTVKRKDMSRPEVRTFSMEDAKIAGLWGKGVWQKYPKRMLQMRARTMALRDVFPDVLQGMITTEEAMEIQQNDALSDYSRAIAQPVVKKVETVVEEVEAIEYTPLDKISHDLQEITELSKLGEYYKQVKPTVKQWELTSLVQMCKERRAELEKQENKE